MKPPRRRQKARRPHPEMAFRQEDIPDAMRDYMRDVCQRNGIPLGGVKLQPIARYRLETVADSVQIEMHDLDWVIWCMPGAAPAALPAMDGPGWYEMDVRALGDGPISPEKFPMTLDHVRVLIPGINALVSRTLN